MAFGVTIVCVGALLLIIYRWFKTHFSYWKKRNVPSLTPVPIFGNILDIFLLKYNIGEQLSALYRKSKDPIIGIFMLQRPALLLRDPELIKELLIKNSEVFGNRSVSKSVDADKDPDSTTGLVVGADENWKFIKNAITPAFSIVKRKTIVEEIQNCGDEMTKYLLKKTENSKEINMRNVFVRYAMDSVCAVLFGFDAECFTKEDSPVLLLEKQLFDYRTFRRGFEIAMFFISPVISRVFGIQFMDIECSIKWMNIIEKCRQDRQENNVRRNDYIDLAVDGMNNYKGKGNMLCGSIEIFVAGYEATSSSLSFAAYELASNMEMQQKLREEIKEVTGGEKQLSYENINQLPYLNLFLKELWRHYPILPFLDRVAKRDFHLETPEILIEEGTSVYVSTLGIHMNPEFYPDPESFRPERFLGNINWGVYLPFGKGPRLCLAKRYAEIALKTALVNLLLNFELKKSPRSLQKMTCNSKGFSLQPSGDVYLQVLPLN